MRNSAGELLAILRDHGPRPRSELARMIGVSSAALTSTTSQLLARGVLAEQESSERPKLGRPPINLTMVSNAAFAIGAHFGVGQAEIAITDAMLRPVVTHRMANTESLSPQDLIAMTAKQINRLTEQHEIPRNRLTGVGIAVPGRVDEMHRRNLRNAEPQWAAFPLARAIEEKTGLSAVLEHNATAIALAETRYGAGRGKSGTLYVFMGTGLGAGLAHSSHIACTNRARGPVEIGHLVTDYNGLNCHCGATGCLETVFSGASLERLLGDRGSEGLIAAAMASLDWDRHYMPFVRALAATVTLMVPELVVLGGHLGEAPDSFLKRLQSDLTRSLPDQFRENLAIRRSSFDQVPAALGAAAAGLEQFFYGGAVTHHGVAE